MALIICKECRRQFSDLAPACPGCGAPTSYSVDGSLPPPMAATVAAPEPAQPAQVDAGPELTEPASDVTEPAETAPLSAYQFVVEHTSPVDLETATTNRQHRSVSPSLLLGIVFLPWLFYWLLLRNGHSNISRISGFLWLLLCTGGLLALSYGLSEREAPIAPPVSESTQTEQPTQDLSNPVFYPLSGKNTDTASSPDTTRTADNGIPPADASQTDNSQPPLSDNTVDTTNTPSASIYSSSDNTEFMQQKLTDCLQQQANTGNYTLSDNGKSVAKMISVCYSDFKPWFDQCLINKHDAKTCNLDAIDITSSILRLKEQ